MLATSAMMDILWWRAGGGHNESETENGPVDLPRLDYIRIGVKVMV